MSKTLLIDNRIFNDSWFYSLSPDSKLLFLFLLLNDVSNIIGCYEIPIQIIISYTGLSDKRLQTCFKELKSKVVYHNGWVIVKNYCKYNPMRNPSIEVAQKKLEKTLPEEIYTLYTACGHPVDTLYTGSKEQEQEKEDINTSINNKGGVGDQGLVPYEEGELVVAKKKHSSVDDITAEDLMTIAEEFKVPLDYVERRLRAMKNWMSAKGKTYKNYYAGLKTWIEKDVDDFRKKIDPYKRGIDATGLS
ncbi:MAG: hypothetical protein KCHDKBKB_00710 [Elusimicrobia bacterium]|nr:hypothetical protein [Elusimicrobiota bacterium]